MKKLISIITGMLVTVLGFGQQAIYSRTGDHVRLQADEFEGAIQWQSSVDGNTWENIQGGNLDPFEVSTNAPTTYYRAEIQRDGCDPHFSEVITATNNYNLLPALLWSDPATWGSAGKPQAGQVATIPEGKRIIMDENPSALAGLTIEGKLEFARKDIALSSEWIMVMEGILEIGTEAQPFEHNAIITLTDVEMEETIHGMGTRGIMVMGGTLELHGATPNVVWTKINAHAPAGSTSLTLMESAAWHAGDEIVIAPTDYYQAGNGASISQRVTLSAVNNTQLTLSTGLNAFRWGQLQYATTSGMSLSPTNLLTPPVPDTETSTTPLILDERAEVGNLTRKIVIQAPDDNVWRSQGFGAHVMIMGPQSTAHVEGVEFRRAGQSGRLGRYPFHWHMLSYSGTQTLADATGQYLKNSAINTSRNRGIVIHGTNGVLVKNNIVYDIQGHGIFTEDAVERRNTIDGNLVLYVRNPPVGRGLKIHESGGRGSSGFWISNPDNIITNNVSADCGTNGYWLAFTSRPWGLSSSVLGADGLLLNPSRVLFGVFDNNTAHSNRGEAINLDRAEVDTEGNTFAIRYYSTTDGKDRMWPFPNQRRFVLSRSKVWKNFSNGSWVRALWVDERGAVSADNCGRFFAGAGDEGVIERSLVVGTSLNHLMNGTGRPPTADVQFGYSNATPTGVATYHSTFDIENNIFVNFQLVANDRSGVFASDDYYIRPVEKGQSRNVGNLLINSHPGVKLQNVQPDYKLASAIFDPNGNWGPAGNYFVFDDPFLVYGKIVIPVTPGPGAGGVSAPGPFYGFVDFVLHGLGDTPPQNQPWSDLMGIHVRRLDNDLNEIATWTVQSAREQNSGLGHMRHFATSPDGIYELTFPGETMLPTNFQMNVENMMTTSDTQVIGVQYNGSLNPIVRMVSGNAYEQYQPVSSLQEVRNSAGATWWQDKPNNMVWMKLRGGIWAPYGDPEALSDQQLYETTQIRIYVP